MTRGDNMRTTLDVDLDVDLDELVRLTSAPSRSAAVAAGLRALRERLALRALADLVETSDPAPARGPRRRRTG
jgi:hypothetical protein